MGAITLFGVTFSLAAIIGISAGILAVILIILSLLTCCCCYMCRGRSPKRRRLDEIAPAPMYPPAMSAAGPGVYAKGMGPRGALPPGPYPHSLSHQQMMGGTEMLPPRYIPPPSPAALMQSPMRPLLGAPPPAGKPGAGAQEEGVVAKWEKDLRAGMFRKVGLAEVEAATGKFSKRAFLGEGAFAAVYKGRSPSGVPWAVKRSKRRLTEGSAGASDFENEVMMISRLSHKNLVRLLGYCTEGGEHILLYEFAENATLSRALGRSQPPFLSFAQRLEIALGTAEGLHYLHNASSPPIVHRDIKPDNILLDGQMRAKVADFGLLKNIMEGGGAGEVVSSVYTRVAGTPGYLDPEYHCTSKVTVKGDVYSFGVVLLELFTGQRAIMMNSRKPGGGDGANPVHISQWAAPLVASKALDELADPKMGGEFEPAVLLRALEIALLCVRPSSKQRPDMGAVVRGLAELREQIMARDEPPETFVEDHARGLDDPDSDEEAEAAQAEQGRAEGSMRVGEETDAPSQEYSRGMAEEEAEEEREDAEGEDGLIGAADEEQGLVGGSYRGSDIGAGPRQLSGRRTASGRSGLEGSGRNLGSASGAGSSGRRTEGEPGGVKYSAGVETFDSEEERAHGLDPSSRQYGAPEAANTRSSYYDSGFVYPVGAFGNAYDSGWMPPHGGDRGEDGERAGSHVVVNLGASSRR
ncbi:unnamed protein product [Closterium sp. Yama58-4]|nr:unnamed protein product [Closterium sp. Yama58-4]